MTIRFDIHIPKKGKHKLMPSVAIQLIWESLEEAGQGGEILVTPSMNTEKEIDATIDHLIEELNLLREKTKLELRRREQEKNLKEPTS